MDIIKIQGDRVNAALFDRNTELHDENEQLRRTLRALEQAYRELQEEWRRVARIYCGPTVEDGEALMLAHRLRHVDPSRVS